MVYIAWRGCWLQGELEELEVATMAIALGLHLPTEPEGESADLELNQKLNPLLCSPPPPFIGVLDLFPQNLGGKGYHMATKEEAGCTII